MKLSKTIFVMCSLLFIYSCSGEEDLENALSAFSYSLDPVSDASSGLDGGVFHGQFQGHEVIIRTGFRDNVNRGGSHFSIGDTTILSTIGARSSNGIMLATMEVSHRISDEFTCQSVSHNQLGDYFYAKHIQSKTVFIFKIIDGWQISEPEENVVPLILKIAEFGHPAQAATALDPGHSLPE